MAIQFVCPYGHRLKAPDHRAGKKGRCPTCHQRVFVPEANPNPSGREKRQWDASGADRIELDEPMMPAAEASSSGAVTVQEPAVAALSPAPGSAQGPAAPIVAEVELPDVLVAAGADAPPAPPDQPTTLIAAVPPPPPGAPLAGTCVIPPPPPPYAVQGANAAPPAPSEATDPLSSTVSTASPGESARFAIARPMPRWFCWADDEGVERADRPHPQQIETTYWLAVVLLFVIVFAAAPSLAFLRLDKAPPWAQIMLLIAGVQLAYAVWLMIVPDWSSVWIGMWVFGVSAALYAAGMGLFAMSSQAPAPLGVTASAASASGWCGAIVLVLGLLSYACGHVSMNWRKEWHAARKG